MKNKRTNKLLIILWALFLWQPIFAQVVSTCEDPGNDSFVINSITQTTNDAGNCADCNDITITLDIDVSIDMPGADWIHGVSFDAGGGWHDISFTPPAGFIFSPTGCTGCAAAAGDPDCTGAGACAAVGNPGYYYDGSGGGGCAATGFPAGANDGDPCNNFGAGGGVVNVVSALTLSICGCDAPGGVLPDVIIYFTDDGASGGWSNCGSGTSITITPTPIAAADVCCPDAAFTAPVTDVFCNGGAFDLAPTNTIFGGIDPANLNDMDDTNDPAQTTWELNGAPVGAGCIGAGTCGTGSATMFDPCCLEPVCGANTITHTVGYDDACNSTVDMNFNYVLPAADLTAVATAVCPGDAGPLASEVVVTRCGGGAWDGPAITVMGPFSDAGCGTAFDLTPPTGCAVEMRDAYFQLNTGCAACDVCVGPVSVMVYPDVSTWTATETAGSCGTAATVVIQTSGGMTCNTITGNIPADPGCGNPDDDQSIPAGVYDPGFPCGTTVSYNAAAAICSATGCNCPATVDFLVDDVCSGTGIAWTAGPTCAGLPGFPNEVVDLFIYDADGDGIPDVGGAPGGYTVNIPPNTETFGVDAIDVINPDITNVGFDFTCTTLPSFPAITNNTCSPFIVTFFLAVFDHSLDNDGDTASEYESVCAAIQYDVTIYPTLSVVEVTDGSNCGTPLVELRDGDGDVCVSYSGIGMNGAGGAVCLANADALMYDFTAEMVITDLAAAPAGCMPTGLTGTIQCLDCCTPAAACNLLPIVMNACTIPLELTVPGDVFSGIESCGDPVTMSSMDVGDTDICGPNASFTRTYTLFFGGVPFTTCVQMITITDNEVPDIVCPPNIDVDCAESTLPANTGMATATDNCNLPADIMIDFTDVSTQTPAGCGNTNYTITRTWTAADCSGTGTCVQTINVIDMVPPMINCPPNASITCEEDTSPANTGMANATDNCVAPGDIMIDFMDVSTQTGTGCGMFEYTITRTWTASDCVGTGSCMQIINVTAPPPTISCPAGFAVECPEDIVVDESDVTVTTSCGQSFNVGITGPSISGGAPGCPGTEYTYFYVAADECGRQVQCSRIFTIDNVGPTVTCPATATVECIEDFEADFAALVTTSACNRALDMDATEPVLNTGLNNCTGSMYEVVYTVVDDCGRSASCTQMVMIDNAAPMILSGPTDEVVLCSADIEAAEMDEFMIEVSCDLAFTLTAGATVALDDLGDCPGAMYSITYTLEDACSRSVTYTQNFEVQNNAPRVFPDEDQYVSCIEDVAPRWELCFVETDCDLGIVSYEIIGPVEDEDTPDCNGKVINYLYSVWDACGRMTCVAQAWIIQNDGPSFDAMPEDITVACSEVPDGSEITASFSDCGEVTVMMTETITPLAGLDYRINRMFTASDDCGNTITAEQQITVICNGPSNDVEMCTLEQGEWGNAEFENEEGLLTIKLLESFEIDKHGFELGASDRRIVIADYSCILRWLPAEGSAAVLPNDLGEIKFGEGECFIEGDLFNENGTLTNTLAGETIALKLNLKKEKDLSEVFLSEICILPAESFNGHLSENPQVFEVEKLADETLGGIVEVSPYEVEALVRGINVYFSDCNVLNNCEETGDYEIPGGKDTGKETAFGNGFSAISIAPNPVTDVLQLTYQLANKGQGSIQIYNTSGVLVFEKVSTMEEFATREDLDVSNWPVGLYFVKLQSGKELITKRLIKQN